MRVPGKGNTRFRRGDGERPPIPARVDRGTGAAAGDFGTDGGGPDGDGRGGAGRTDGRQDRRRHAGTGTIAQVDPTTVKITQKSGKIIIEWENFDIAEGEKVIFDQPDALAAALNRVLSGAKT
ncbi:MAG: hypothetical protein IRY94_00175 [Rhodospirillaceae bacterium]|nr:hypothetical protein [Rhodospirillaceae bacterium]